MTDISTQEPRTTADKAARAITEVGAPWVLNIVASLIIGVAVGAPGWGVFVAIFGGVVPMVFILVGMRRAKISDHHVTRINERHMLIASLLVVTGGALVVQIVAGAPIEMIAFLASGLAALAVAAVITSIFHWKVSGHAGASAAIAVVLALSVSPWWYLALALTPVIGWSRIHLGDHTKSQVVAGAIAGAIAAGLTYIAIV
ncbi:phosphatase PAP2 family protein [Rhodococcus sp. JT-3]|uniref:phosphatase PAP2 family protein n=1 Tax=Rhodococcus sp. JT-3 TaxID=1973213 RepID=UPI001302F4B0|nr:phosphatase PAP2 family protein [Rhodococcus sp. JT-3]